MLLIENDLYVERSVFIQIAVYCVSSNLGKTPKDQVIRASRFADLQDKNEIKTFHQINKLYFIAL